jgi:hypothetical protein
LIHDMKLLDIVNQYWLGYLLFSMTDYCTQTSERPVASSCNASCSDPTGEIIQLELLPSFAYLNELILRMDGSVETSGNKKTDEVAGQCSDYVQYSGLYRTRICNLLDVNEALCQLS